MKRKLVLLIIVAMMSALLPSCGDHGTIPSSSNELSTGEISQMLPEHDILNIDDLFGRTGIIYRIDKEYMDEMNRNRNVCNAERGEITYKYRQKWKEKMVYYYDALYGALNVDGKKILKRSQDYWQKAFDSDLELNGEVQAENLIIYDVFDNPYYNAYRARAIALYIKCSSMNNLYDPASDKRVYDDLE